MHIIMCGAKLLIQHKNVSRKSGQRTESKMSEVRITYTEGGQSRIGYVFKFMLREAFNSLSDFVSIVEVCTY